MNLLFIFIIGVAMSGIVNAQPKVEKVTLEYQNRKFEVIHIVTDNPTKTVLFSVGSGGNPERHLPLLTYLAEHGITVIAPIFPRIVSPYPTEEELEVRANQLTLALDMLADSKLEVSGIGHSIGATLLIGLAGGQLWLGPNQQVNIPSGAKFDQLVLMCPPTGFFRAPNSLDKFNTSFQAWAGANDRITPPTQIQFLSQILSERVEIDLRIDEEAGHFTFMNTLPPNVRDPHPDRESFLNTLASEVRSYLKK